MNNMMDTTKCKWQKIDDEERKLLENILEQHDNFEYDEYYSRGKTYPSDADTMLDIGVFNTYYLDTTYDEDLLALTEKVKDVIHDFQQEGYYSIKFYLDHGPDYMYFAMRLYRVRTEEER